MRNRKLGTLLALLMVLAMCVWTLSACGESGGEAEDQGEPAATEAEGYTNAEVDSDLSMADEVKAYYDAVDMDYAYDLGYELAYDWDNLAEANGWRSAGSDAEHATADYLAKEWESDGCGVILRSRTAAGCRACSCPASVRYTVPLASL